MTYSEQLKNPEWQKRRLEIMQAADFRCQDCGTKETTLNVHHKIYIKGRKVWEYDEQELACLCEKCHELTHKGADELKTLIARVPHHVVFQLLNGYIKGFLSYNGIPCVINNDIEANGASDFLRISPYSFYDRESRRMIEPLPDMEKLADLIHAGHFDRRRG